jgi:hypothetical protein
MSEIVHTITVRMPDGLGSWEIEERIREEAKKPYPADYRIVNLKSRGGVYVDQETRDTSWTYEHQVVRPIPGTKAGMYV